MAERQCSRPNVRESVMPTTTRSNVPRTRDEIGVVVCQNCGKPMKLSCTSLGFESYDLKTFDCDKCARSKSFVVHEIALQNSN